MPPRGMQIPVQVGKNGGARLVAGSPYTHQIVMAGLTPNLSQNPFQTGDGVEVGISGRIVFMVNDAAAAGMARSQIVQLFKRLRAAGLAKLVGTNGIQVEHRGEELVASVRYVDLEADAEGAADVTLKGPTRGTNSVGGSR